MLFRSPWDDRKPNRGVKCVRLERHFTPRFGFRSSQGCASRHRVIAGRETGHPGILGIRCRSGDLMPLLARRTRRKAGRHHRRDPRGAVEPRSFAQEPARRKARPAEVNGADIARGLIGREAMRSLGGRSSGLRRHAQSTGARANASGASRLAGISAGVGLTLDDLFGQPNQHPSCAVIPQFVKGPQQAQFQQRLQRTQPVGRMV